MPRHSRPFNGKLPDLNFVLLVVMLIVLWIAGGASRPDVLGQTVVRATAWLVAIAGLLFVPRPKLKPVCPVVLLLFALAGLIILQLIPLPPSIWIELPGREILARSAVVSNQPQPWRPISLSPSASVNSLSSLVVPVLILFLAASLRREDKRRLLPIVLGLIVVSSMVGLLQFSGSRFQNPLINDTPGAVSATFANRNHFGLFLACGCVLAPAWAFHSRRSSRWKAIVAAALVLVFVLMLLATGSRMAMLLGLLGIALGIFSVWPRMKQRLLQLPRSVWVPLVCATTGVLVLSIYISVSLGRAMSVDRALLLGASGDLRTAALPTIWRMVQSYWPVGSGFGAFDPVYRIHEADALLSNLYLNHAHNDWLEVVLDGGLLGLSLLLAALGWWIWASIRAWRVPFETRHVLPRVGSALLLMIGLASLVDYPARTPLVMALVIIAAFWLSTPDSPSEQISDKL